jgi:hypothetical protein
MASSRYSTRGSFFATDSKIRFSWLVRSENFGSRIGGSPSQSTRVRSPASARIIASTRSR